MKKTMIFLAMVMMLVLSIPNAVQAASKQSRAKDAYKTFLKKYESNYIVPEFFGATDNKENYKYCSYYAIKDLNKDKIPELLTIHDTNYKQGDIHIFTYKDGKVEKVKNGKVSITNSASEGWFHCYFCRNMHLHVERDGGFEAPHYRVYRLSDKGKLVKYLELKTQEMKNKTIYKKNGKNVSAKIFSNAYKQCGEKQEDVDWKENIAVNRAKI